MALALISFLTSLYTDSHLIYTCLHSPHYEGVVIDGRSTVIIIQTRGETTGTHWLAVGPHRPPCAGHFPGIICSIKGLSLPIPAVRVPLVPPWYLAAAAECGLCWIMKCLSSCVYV